jgi:hypothetical protein
MNKYYLLLTALVAGVYSSCNKINGPTPDALQSISLRDTLSMYTGNVVNLDIQVTPTSYDTTAFVWGSSDTSVIAVTNKGKITAKNEGTSTISVSNAAKTKSVSCIVTVKDSLNVGLIAYYPFNNSSADVSGNLNNGIATDLTGVNDRFGVANSAYYFNGSSSFILVKDKPTLRLAHTSFTITTWVKLDEYNYSYGSQVVDKRAYGEGSGWNFSITGTAFYSTGQGAIGLPNFNEGSTALTTLGTTALSLSSWHMVTTVYKYDIHEASLYVDGVFTKSFSGFPSPNSATDADMFIGKDNPEVSNGYFIKGAMDELRFYSRALTTKEIKKLYARTH